MKRKTEDLQEPVIPEGMPENFVMTPRTGLTDEEARERVKAGMSNARPKDEEDSVLRILARNLFTLFNLLNVVLAVALALVGAWRNMLFLGVVVSNTLIGTVQELRARKTIRRLQMLSENPAVAVRSGREVKLKPDDLVQGDLILLRAGNQVPADAIVVDGVGAANESVLTGESEAVEKRAGDWLLSGSYVAAGSFLVQLERVGEASYISQVSARAKTIKMPRSELMSNLQALIRQVSIILIPVGLLLFARQYFLRKVELPIAVSNAVASMIGMIPEGLMLMTSVALMVGVIRLGRKKTLVQQLYGIESLARADTLCLDKTGTLTTGTMHLERMEGIDADEEELRESLRRFLSATDAVASPTLRALAMAVPPEEEIRPLAELPFTSRLKKSAVTIEGPVTLILGAPSFVLGPGHPAVSRAAELAKDGLRVMTLCEAQGQISEGETPPVTRVLGLLALGDTVRDHAADTLSYFAGQGVRVKVISGDDPVTVSSVARAAGLPGADSYVDVSALTDGEVAAAAEECTVFGRVTPERKKALVEAMQAAGHTVAMTGDGVNDIPAFKAADCSIAMAGGSDAAKHVAQLTLLDADFAHLPQVVDEGRRVINNVTRLASLFLVKTLYSIGLSVLLLLIPAAYPFQPIQLTLVSSLTVGIPGFFLALENNPARVKGHFLRTVLIRALPGGVAVTLVGLIAMLMEHTGWPQAACSNIAAVGAFAMGFLALGIVCLPLNWRRGLLLTALLAAFTVAETRFGHVFYFVPFTLAQRWVLAGLILFGSAVSIGLLFLLRRRAEGGKVPLAKPLRALFGLSRSLSAKLFPRKEEERGKPAGKKMNAVETAEAVDAPEAVELVEDADTDEAAETVEDTDAAEVIGSVDAVDAAGENEY
ncbi:MAG: HAD-IC family P-type ATPase [Clostridia bacterium]|nr:HAD-IC family P-type ATPase [Clostridia bacterium]